MAGAERGERGERKVMGREREAREGSRALLQNRNYRHTIAHLQ
jgi:hypothetical protein